MAKTIFLHNLSKFFFGHSVNSVPEKKIDEICQKDSFCHFWDKIRF